MNLREEKKLVRDIIAGDNDAASTFFVIFRPKITVLAGRFFPNNPADREDATSDALLHLLTTFPKWKAKCALGTWVYSVSRRIFLGKLRAAGAGKRALIVSLDAPQRDGEEFSEELHLPRPRKNTAEERAINTIFAHELIAKLKPQNAHILITRVVEGKLLSEIAKDCGLSLEATKARHYQAVHRARGDKRVRCGKADRMSTSADISLERKQAAMRTRQAKRKAASA